MEARPAAAALPGRTARTHVGSTKDGNATPVDVVGDALCALLDLRLRDGT